MERLTIRNSDGSVSQPTDLKWSEALEKLAAYEDTGVEPEEVRSVKWIPVSERLPEYGRPVLLYFNRNNHNSMGVGDYYHDGDTLIWRGCGFIPTHWMPLPEPPEGGADG